MTCFMHETELTWLTRLDEITLDMSKSADDGLSIGRVQTVLGWFMHGYDMHACMVGGRSDGQVVKSW